MNFDLRFYRALIQRRLPVMMLLLLVCAGLGVATALKLPDTYMTSARLLVEAAQIPDNMVASTVQTDAIEQLDIIEQKLMTRANLIDIAHRFKVFENIRNMEPDQVVAAMNRATQIRRTAGRERATLMTISFTARSGKVAADVVNQYVTLVLEENTEFRRSRAENTLQFFEQEVDRLGQELDRQSSAIATFKSEHADALPEDQSYRLGRLNLLQERLAGMERDMKAVQAQRQEIVRIYETTGRVSQDQNMRPRSAEEQRLISARAALENARAVYSETSPKVVQLKAIVDRLEKVVSEQAASGLEGSPGEVPPEQALLNATLAEIDTKVKSLQDAIDSTTSEMEELQRAISESAANGIQINTLERDYTVFQNRYAAAVNNLNAARMSERVETTAQGQRISVIENANVPRVPSGPDRPKTAIMGAAAGMGLAGAYFMLLELLNRAIRRPAELTGRFNIIPITTIPYLESRREKLFRRMGLVTATLIVLISVPLGLWYIDTHYMPLELIVQKGLGKFGIG